MILIFYLLTGLTGLDNRIFSITQIIQVRMSVLNENYGVLKDYSVI